MVEAYRASSQHPRAEGDRLVIALDRSASMSYDGKLDRAKQLASERLAKLEDEEEFSVVVFDHLAEILIPLSLKKGLSNLGSALGKIGDRGNTNISLALRTAADLFKGEGGQVLILTDGRANTATNGGGSEGDPTVEREIIETSSEMSGRGVVVSAIALGGDSFISLLEKCTRTTEGELLVDVDGKLEKAFDLQETKVSIQSFPRDLPAGKPTWTKELNTRHVTVASQELCDRFERSRICFLLNPDSNERARVSLLSIDDPQLASFRGREPKIAKEVTESLVILVDRTYRSTLRLHKGDMACLCM